MMTLTQTQPQTQPQAQTYIEKLESYFNQDFLAMSVNTELKRWSVVSYVRMLEEMCRNMNIEVKREYFPIPSYSVYINDQFGTEKCWRIYEETSLGTYKINHYELITEIYIDKIYRDLDNRLCYPESIYVPEDIGRFSLSFLQEMHEKNEVDVFMGV